MSYTSVTNPVYLQAIQKQPHRVYMYILKDELDSIKQHGYLSVFAQKNKFGKLPQNVINKYKDQMADASMKYFDLKKRIENRNIDDQVIEYLDWRMEEDIPINQHGSSAIYVLYYPIPNELDIINYVTKVRHFATDRILLSTVTTSILYPIPPDALIPMEQYNSRKYWVDKWHEQMNIDTPNPLWLQGIPHAYFFPDNGLIPFNEIKVEDFLFAQ